MGARAYKIRLFVLVCHLQVHLSNVEGFAMPRQKMTTTTVIYKVGDILHFELSFKNFPELPENQYWLSTVYEHDKKKFSSLPKQVSFIKHLKGFEKHVHTKQLDVAHDRIVYFVKVENEVKEEYYQEDFISLLQNNYTNQAECLKNCSISFDIWNKKRRISVITEPELRNVTYYQIGDRFSHTCRSPKGETMTLSWIQQKAVYIPSSKSSIFIDIVLDKSHNNTDIWCQASYYYNESRQFEDIFVATKLILLPRITPDTAVPWYIIIIVVVITITVFAALIYFYRKRYVKKHDYDYIMEVQNDLYGAATSLQYAQLYEHCARQPPPPPPAHRTLYAKIIGYLR